MKIALVLFMIIMVSMASIASVRYRLKGAPRYVRLRDSADCGGRCNSVDSCKQESCMDCVDACMPIMQAAGLI
jgi:hypothetical protein